MTDTPTTPTLTPEQQAQLRLAKRIDDVITAWRVTRCPRGLMDPATGYLHGNSSAVMGMWLELNVDVNTFSVDTMDKCLAETAHKLHWYSEEGRVKPAAEEAPKVPKPLKQSMPLTKHDVRKQLEENQAKELADRKSAEEWLEKARQDHERANSDPYPGMVYYDEKSNAKFAGRPNHRAHSELVEAWAKRNPEKARARGIAVK